ncbi:hypothetical protein EDB19DRAFT_1831243 [Suillus lakei]|nr:hypothetical protein EDB19DRAFT_1831243 [Suillus lakei]
MRVMTQSLLTFLVSFLFLHPLHLNSSLLLVHPGSLARDPGLEVSANASSTRPSGGVSLAREASDMAQLTLPVVQAFTGVIPIVGGPMKAAIAGLLAILQTIDTHDQNKADLDGLTIRLGRLSQYLYNAPPAQGPQEKLRREAFVRSSPDAPWSSHMQSQNDMHEVLTRLGRHEEFLMRIEGVLFHGQSSVGPNVTLGCVKLVDATGREHPIPTDVCDSFERFNGMLRLLLGRNSIQARVQRRYMEQGEYDSCIDDDKQVTRLTNYEWPSIEEGATIVMNVTFKQPKTSGFDYKCHFCDAVNHLSAGSIMYSLQRKAGCSIDW